MVEQKITLDVHEIQQKMIYSQLDQFLGISRSFKNKILGIPEAACDNEPSTELQNQTKANHEHNKNRWILLLISKQIKFHYLLIKAKHSYPWIKESQLKHALRHRSACIIPTFY